MKGFFFLILKIMDLEITNFWNIKSKFLKLMVTIKYFSISFVFEQIIQCTKMA